MAAEPSEWRAEIAEHTPGVRVVGAAAEALPLSDGSADALICAQSFHWFATPGALREFHRVLRDGAGLGLIWNSCVARAGAPGLPPPPPLQQQQQQRQPPPQPPQRQQLQFRAAAAPQHLPDAPVSQRVSPRARHTARRYDRSVPWVRELGALVESCYSDEPRQVSGEWVRAFDADAGSARLFGPLQRIVLPYALEGTSEQGVVDRVLSTSVVHRLGAGPKADVEAAVRALLARHPDAPCGDRAAPFPYITEYWWTFKRPR